MSFEISAGGVWVPEGATQIPKSATKNWQDVLYAVRGGQLEAWDISKKPPFESNYTIHRALSIIGSNVAQVPMKFYQRSNGELVLYSDSVYNLFESPNANDSNYDLWEQTIIYLYNYGEVMWYLSPSDVGNKIVGMQVLNPSYMKHTKSKVTGYIDNWVFDNKIPLAVDNVIHFKFPSMQGLRGMSPLNTILTELSSDEQAALFNYSYFKNGAKLGGVLYTDQDVEITKEELKMIVDTWNSGHQGSNNAYKVAGLLGGMKYQEISTSSMKDMEFLQSRKDIRDKILVLLGVNPTVMGISENVNLANAQMGIRQFTELTLIPLLIRLKQKLNATMFRTFYPDYYCEFDIQSIQSLKDDFNKQILTAKELIGLGYTRNEVNERLSLDMPESDDSIDLVANGLVYRHSIGSNIVKPDTQSKVEQSDTVDTKDIVDTKSVMVKNTVYKKVKSFFYKQRCSVINNLLKGVDFITDDFISNQNTLLMNSISKLELNIAMDTLTDLNSMTLKEVLLTTLDNDRDTALDKIREIYNGLEKLCYKFSMLVAKEYI